MAEILEHFQLVPLRSLKDLGSQLKTQVFVLLFFEVSQLGVLHEESDFSA